MTYVTVKSEGLMKNSNIAIDLYDRYQDINSKGIQRPVWPDN